ncbi:MAG TPA: hypothetical protein VGJ39_08420 [Vicinamibacterales bacterium]
MATTAWRRLILAIVPAALIWIAACSGDTPTTPATTPPSAPAQPVGLQGCAGTSVGLKPLTDLGSGMYKSQPGGLYAGGANLRPAGHEAAGVALARAIQPMNNDGTPGSINSPGRYVLISIGMSNTTQEFSTFKPLADADLQKDPRLTIVDGAQGGQTGSAWANPGCQCWTVLAQRLASAGVTANQVAIAWIKLAEAGPTQGFPQAARILQGNIVTVIQQLKQRFPNLKLAYLSSRIYAGYATSTLNPEPYAYESGFSVRWAIEQLMNDASAPWVSWGPYLWADGTTPRADGLTWACSDLVDDGTHPSTTGRQKVAGMLLTFFKSDATAREWFLSSP